MMMLFNIFVKTTKIGLTGSTYFTVAISVERFIGLVFPLESATGKRRSLICYCIPVVILTIVVAVPNLYIEIYGNWAPSDEATEPTNSTINLTPNLTTSSNQAPLVLDDSMKTVINHQHYASVHDMACTTVIPLTILIICNGGIFLKLRRSRIEMFASRNTSTQGVTNTHTHINGNANGSTNNFIAANRSVGNGTPTTANNYHQSNGHVNNSPGPSRANSKGNRSDTSGSPSAAASSAASSGATAEKNLAFVLFGIVLVFLVCHTCRLITSCFEASMLESIIMCNQIAEKQNITLWPSVPVFLYIITPLSHLLLMINSSVNFLIYCAVGSRFRTALCTATGQLRRNLSHRANTHSRGAGGGTTMPDEQLFQNGGASARNSRRNFSSGNGVAGSAGNMNGSGPASGGGGRNQRRRPAFQHSFHTYTPGQANGLVANSSIGRSPGRGGASSNLQPRRTVVMTSHKQGDNRELTQLLPVEPATAPVTRNDDFPKHFSFRRLQQQSIQADPQQNPGPSHRLREASGISSSEQHTQETLCS